MFSRERVKRVLLAAVLCCLAASGAPAQWSAPIQVSNAPQLFSFYQSYDFDSTGHIHMVWRSWDDATPDMYYSTNLSGSFTQSKVNTAKNNILVITPQDQVLHYFYNTNDELYEKTKPVSGGSWSAATRIDQNPSGGFIQDVVVDPSGGILFSWGHLFDSGWTPASGAYARYKPYGGSWGSTEFIQGINNDIWPQTLQLIATGAKIYASYRLTNTTSGARYKVRQSGAWSPEVYVTSNAYSCNMAASPTGELCCTYFNPDPDPQSGTDWNVYAKFSTDSGATWGPEYVVRDQGDLQRASLCIYDAHGNLYLGWEGRDTESAKFNLYCRTRIGQIWQAPEIIETRTGITAKAFHIYNNVLWATYSQDTGSGTYNQVWLKYRNLSNDWTAPASVSSLIATGGENRVTLSWHNPSDSDYIATVVRASTSGYPAGPFTDREVCVRAASPGNNDSFIDYRLPASATYYYSIFTQDSSGNWSAAAHATASTSVDVTPPTAVTSFTAQPYTNNNLLLSWTNPSDIDFKGTMVRYRTTGYPTSTSDGFLVCSKTASPGSADSYVHTGLTVGVTYYYKAFAYDSETLPNYATGAAASGAAILATCGFVKQRPNNWPVDLLNKVVTGIFSSDACMYVEEPNRTSGIRLAYGGAMFAVGDRVNVTGTLATRSIGGYPAERQVNSPILTWLSSSGGLAPLALNCKAVGGAAVLPDLPGVRDGVGLNNVGSLVKLAGKVTLVLGSYVYIDDGTGIDNGDGTLGVMVACAAPPSVVAGNIVSAVGIVQGSIPSGWTESRRMVQARYNSDIVLMSSNMGTVHGYVTDSDWNGIPGATISTTSGGYSTTTDGSGAYTLTNVIAGKFSVTATKTGYNTVSQDITLAADQDLSLDLVMSPNVGSISGLVRNTNSVGIAGATVTTNTGGHTATTNSSGGYTISGVTPGTYSVTASKAGYAPQTLTGKVVTAGYVTYANFILATQ